MTKLENALRGSGRSTATEAAAADAASRFASAAAASGSADVAYAIVPSPLGDLLAAVTPRGLVTTGYVEAGLDSQLERLARRISPRVLEAPARLDDVRRELDEYFEGARRSFDVPLDWSLVSPGFGRKVLQATARIPFGDASTYAEIAARAGSPKAMRATGNALGANPMPIVVPCHRVLRSGGGLGGYTGGLDRKRFLLGLEGVSA